MGDNNLKSVLIVGQGLAGSILADRLINANVKVAIVDRAEQSNASKIAAGIVNPITGRRFVLSWMIDELIPVLKTYYNDFEERFNTNVMKRRIILRGLFSFQEENDWDGRTTIPMYQNHISNLSDEGDYATMVHSTPAVGAINGYQVDVPKFVKTMKDYFEQKGMLEINEFDYNGLLFEGDQVSYKSNWYDAVVFCDGWSGELNPFFNYLPFNRSKGEILIIKVPNAKFHQVYKNGLFIAPLDNDLYWVGASNKWHTVDIEPTEEKRIELIQKLERILKVPYEIIEHKAAIRPTVRDRRPFLGQHPEIDKLFIFNGLGTKGASLAPYWSKVMIDFLLHQKQLPNVVDIQRFAV
jgi:glycine/D-amino acid oxidase-like deaminating enzyme